MISPSEPGRRRAPDELQVELQDALVGSVRLASSDLLLTAKAMLEAQIASRRAMMTQPFERMADRDVVALQIQKRVDRIGEIVAELRKRNVAVEWEE